MGAITRDLLPFAVGRNTVEQITSIVLFTTLLDNGSASWFKEETPVLARVVALTPNEIQRLLEAGITVNQGVSVSIVGELPKAPDQIVRADGTIMKVVQFTIEEGATILAADIPALGADGQQYGSGYSAP